MLLKRLHLLRPFALSRTLSKLAITASALKGVPSWNFTPDLSSKVNSVASELAVHLVARPGTWFSLSSKPMSVSYIVFSIEKERLSLVSWGSRVVGLVACATTMLPPALGCPLGCATDWPPPQADRNEGPSTAAPPRSVARSSSARREICPLNQISIRSSNSPSSPTNRRFSHRV